MFDSTSSPRDILKQRIAEMWNAGSTASQIAAECGVSKNVVVGIRDRMGLPARPRPIKGGHKTDGSFWTHEKHEQARHLACNTNLSWVVIGRQLGCPPATVASYCRRRKWVKEAAPSTSDPRAPVQRVSQHVTSAAGVPQPIPLRALTGGGCRWPMWGDRERATHVYCEQPVIALIGEDGIARVCAYCRKHRRVSVTKTVLRVAA